ncbi:hypothetical protein BGX23_010315 [Mortierella sp. AD031]|nr:hypothetical protein BGX23_010315 [Mortierella sp. AD031]
MSATDLKIVIAGCGIGGLSAAIALELAGFDYTILEESPALELDLKPGASATNAPTKTTHIGGAIQVAPTAIHFLNQLGIYEEMKEISKPVSGLSMNEHDMNYVGRIDLSTHRERQVMYGYHTEVMARSQLQSLLLQRVPSKRIVAGKVLGMIQNDEKVTVRCSDGKTYEGDILIAADGAFSNIRHSLYWTLDEKKQLPKADAAPMSVDLHIISGCTKPLDPAKYPVLLDAMSEIQSVQLPDKPYAIWFMPLLDNRIAWDITKEVTKTAIRQGEASKVYQWRPEDVEETLKTVRDYDCPYGGQIGDLLDTTPVENMRMHMSEERFCETWSGGRTVLLGDACHKGFYHPVSEAMNDAVTLVNLLSKLQSDSMDSLTAAFKEYRERRAPTAKAVVEHSTLLRQVFTGKGRAASLKRNVVFNYMPDKVRHLLEDKRHDNRPQLCITRVSNITSITYFARIDKCTFFWALCGIQCGNRIDNFINGFIPEIIGSLLPESIAEFLDTQRTNRVFHAIGRHCPIVHIDFTTFIAFGDDLANMSLSTANPTTTITAAAATATATAIAVHAEVAAWSTVVTTKEAEANDTREDGEAKEEVKKDKVLEAQEQEKAIDSADDSSDDEGEFVNCSQTLDDTVDTPESEVSWNP